MSAVLPLSLCLAVCLPLPVSGLDNSNVFAAAALQQLTLFPDSEIVPRLCVLLHTGGDAVRGGLGDVVLLFSHSVQIEKCMVIKSQKTVMEITVLAQQQNWKPLNIQSEIRRLFVQIVTSSCFVSL